MKKMLITSAFALAAACGLAAFSHAEDPKAPPSTQKSDAPINKYCAIEQEHPIDPAVTYQYKDKLVGFCCKDCIDEFKKDPEKYLKNIK
jgi:YHS domain-containing protein